MTCHAVARMGFHVCAVNTASDSENRIHEDSVAASYGFRGGLVPGVTVYGYMASAVIEHLGPDWLHRGAMDVRFHEPVYAGDPVEITVMEDSGRVRVEAGKCATGVAWIGNHEPRFDAADRAVLRREPSAETLSP